MAEPAHRLDGEPDEKPIYDSPGTAPSDPRPQLKVLEGGGESTEPKRGHLSPAGSENLGRSDIGVAEKQAGEPDSGSFYKGNKKPAPQGFLRAAQTVFGPRRNKILGGGAVAGAVITASIFIFLSLIPFKIMHIVNNLQDRFYATSENALQKQTDIMFKRYVREKLLPSYTNCGTTISRNCSVKVIGKNPVSNLYRTWADARIENKLADRYGIEFQKRPSGWYMKTPSTGAGGINIGGNGEKLDDAFQKANRSDIRKAVKAETKWYQMYYRYKVGRLLEQKYGIKRCIIFCTPKDALADKKDERIRAAKIFTTQRVLVPRTQTLGIVMECLLKNCAAETTKPTEAEPGKNGALNGSAENAQTDTKVREGLTRLAATYGITEAAAINKLIDDYNDISKKGFNNFSLEKVFGTTAAGKLGSGLIPVFGWIDLAARLVNAASDSSSNLKKLSYITNSTAAVSMFAMYRTYTDEMKTGNVNAEELGSFVQSLDSGDRGTKTDPQIGGNVGAEGTPLYAKLFNGEASAEQSSSSGSLVGSIFDSKVLAQTDQQDSNAKKFIYECNNGKPVPAGKIVCSEEVLGVGNKYADIVSDALNTFPLSVLREIAGIWGPTAGKVFDMADYLLGEAFSLFSKGLELSCSVPGASFVNPVCKAKDLAEKYSPIVMEAVVKWLIPNPFSTNMSGGRTFDMIAAGADVAGNDSAHITLGGQKLSDQQVAAIVNEQWQEDYQNYKNQPLLARVFDTESRYSPTTKLAMAMPLGADSARTTVSSIFNNPVGRLGSVFSSIFTPNKVLAAAPSPDPFGVVQYGYPAGAIPEDPEAYWDQFCSDNPSFAYRKDNQWNEDAAKNLDPGTRMPTNSEVNPCLLIMAVAGSAGGFFDSSNLTADDLSDTPTGLGVLNPRTTPPPSETINPGQLFESSVNIPCAAGTKDLGIQDGYTAGKLVKIRICAVSNFPSSSSESNGGFGVSGANGKAVVNSTVSGIIYAMVNAAKADGVSLAAISAFRTMAHQQSLCPCDGVSVAKPGYSNHQMGLAIDFAGLPFTAGPVPGNIFWNWLSANAGEYGYKNYPAEAWHWSPTGN